MKVVANARSAQGTGASRRLRLAGKVPAILYGEGQPVSIEIDHNALFHALKVESFHSSILDMEVDGKSEPVLLRDVQWHPYKQLVLHADFQRVAADHKIHMKVPLHFLNQDASPAVKLGGAMVNHVLTEIDVSCLPKDLPEYIEVDLSGLQTGQTVHLSDVALPAGITAITHGEKDPVLVTTVTRGGASDDGEAGEAQSTES